MAYAAEMAGTDTDLDRDLESAGIEHFVTTLDRAKLTKRLGSLPTESLSEIEEGLKAAMDQLREECGSCVNRSQRLIHSGY